MGDIKKKKKRIHIVSISKVPSFESQHEPVRSHYPEKTKGKAQNALQIQRALLDQFWG